LLFFRCFPGFLGRDLALSQLAPLFGPHLALAGLALALEDQRLLGDRFAPLDEQVANHRVVVAEQGGQLVKGFLAALEIHQNVVRLVDLVDRIGQLPSPPILAAMDLAAAVGDELAVTLDHAGHLPRLVGMHQEHDFVMSH